ncbi:magnesium transporter CorA [bacterium]|nr:magnesium transporter CorA [bacterium]
MYIDAVRELLRKQKLVEGLVKREAGPHPPLIDAVVEKQQFAELENFLSKLAVADVVEILEALPPDEAAMLWQRVPPGRSTDVLWEVSDDLRDRLEEATGPRLSETRVTVFELVAGRIRQNPIKGRKDLEGKKPIWVDLLNASPTQRAYIGEYYKLDLPDPGDETDLEVSNRFHIEENGALNLHSNFLLDRGGKSRSIPVAFILHREILFSLRNEDLPVFRLQRRRAETVPGYASDCFDLLMNLYGSDVEYSADSLEDIYKTLSRVGKHVLSETMTDEEAASVLADIAEEEDLNGRIRANILDTQRAIVFLMQSRVLAKDNVQDAKQVLRNIESLNSHTAFLFDKINFLMDATIGFININQNRRVTQLTMLGLVFLPMNILAGMGGMSEYSRFTEGIPWPISYAAFAFGSGLLGWLTYRYVNRGGLRKARRAEGK